MKKFAKPAALGLAAALMSASAVHATPVVFSATGTAAGVGVAAEASFAIVGNTLTVTLRNTSPSHGPGVQDVPGSTLTGLLFSLPGNPTLTPLSALIAPGSIVQGNMCDVGVCDASTTDVGGEFGYQEGSFAGGADRVIASSGYLSTSLPGNIGNFNNGAAGPNLDNPNSLDGINFGIVSAAPGFDPNGGLANDPLIRDAVTFTLSGVLGLTEFDISNVSFQYGTSWSEANITVIGCSVCGGPRDEDEVVAEPASLALLAAGLVGFASVRRRRGFATRL